MIKYFVLCSAIVLLFATDGFSQSRRKIASKKTANDTITISGVKVKNFYKTAEAIHGDTVILLIGDNSIVFHKNSDTFQMSAMATAPSDFKKNRRLVEGQLLKILGVTRSDACKLRVTLTKNAPGGWDGKEYGLSFCK